MLNHPEIIKVLAHKNYSLDIYLSDNRHVKLDMTPLIKYPCYRKLASTSFFSKVRCDGDIIYWDDMHDMHIDQILKFAEIVE